MDKVRKLMNNIGFFVDENTALTTILLTLCTIGGEQTIEELAFNCPCFLSETVTRYFSPFSHGMLFLFLPAGFLFILGMMMNNRFWKQCHGFCNPSKKSTLTCREMSLSLCSASSRAFLLLAAWIICALMDGDFYVCMQSIQVDVKLPLADNATGCFARETKEYKILKSESQTWAWIVLIVAAVITMICRCACLIRCCSSSSYLHLFRKTYQAKEKERWGQKTEEWCDQNVVLPTETFISQTSHTKEDWDVACMEHSRPSKQGNPSAAKAEANV